MPRLLCRLTDAPSRPYVSKKKAAIGGAAFVLTILEQLLFAGFDVGDFDVGDFDVDHFALGAFFFIA